MQRTGFIGRCAATKRRLFRVSMETGPTLRLTMKCVAFSPMSEPDLIELFVGPLASESIRYLVSGSVAAMLYGEPRVTHDIDFVVFLRSTDIAKLPALYPPPEFY